MSEYLKSDTAMIKQIVERACAIWRRTTNQPIDKNRLIGQMTLVHNDCCALRLEEMMKADDYHITHDVFGIHHHIDISNGKVTLKNCFLPRFAVLKEEAK